MKVCFVGLGSIGKRHIQNLSDILRARGITYCFDALRSSNKRLPESISKCINREYYLPEQIPSDYDVIFITNPTIKHYETLALLKNKAKYFFMEKPVFEDVQYSLDEFSEIKENVYVACPLRYTKVINTLKNLIINVNINNIRVICSSYLPDWRPEVDYRQTYSAKKELGGGVDVDLIHEWDYIQYLFGKPLQVKKFAGKYSTLDINSDDTAVYIGQYEDKLLSLHLDYFGRVPRRQIEIFTDEDIIVADFYNSNIKYLKSGKVLEFGQERNHYQKEELKYFMDIINGKAKNNNCMDCAYETLKIAKG